MSIEIEERLFGITLDGATYPPILSADDNFETALSCSHELRHQVSGTTPRRNVINSWGIPLGGNIR
jgi:hypothetical protein